MFLVEEFLCVVEGVVDELELAVSLRGVSVSISDMHVPCGHFQIIKKVQKGGKSEPIDIRVNQVGNKHVPLPVLPLSHHEMNIMRMNLSAPLFKYFSQLQFGVFPADGVVVLFAVELQDAADVVFGLLGEDDCLVGVQFVQAFVDELVQEGVHLDAELFENALFVDYAHDYLVLFPVHQHFAVCQKQRLFSHFIVDKLL